jgi:hypothetical protein
MTKIIVGLVDPAATRSTDGRQRMPTTGAQAMQYLLLIYQNEVDAAKAGDRTAVINEYRAFTESIIQGGQFKGGNGLQSTATATTVRMRDGKTLTTDGPFAETREQLGGYYLVDAKDLDEAIAIAARVPSARTGAIEVRPIMTYG